jgi:hypothetical protein
VRRRCCPAALAPPAAALRRSASAVCECRHLRSSRSRSAASAAAFTAAAAAAASAAALARPACSALACSIIPLASATSAASRTLRSPCFSASAVTSSTATKALSPLQPHTATRECAFPTAHRHHHLPMKRKMPAYAHQPQEGSRTSRPPASPRSLPAAPPTPRPSCAASAAPSAGAPSPSCRRRRAAAYRSRPPRKAPLHPPPCYGGQRLLMVACWGAALPTRRARLAAAAPRSRRLVGWPAARSATTARGLGLALRLLALLLRPNPESTPRNERGEWGAHLCDRDSVAHPERGREGDRRAP